MRGRVFVAAAAALVLSVAAIRGAGRSEVADAAMKGDKAALHTLIEQKADVNAPQVDGATALHWAVYRDDGEAVDLLLAAGAKADVANREGITPLAMASLFGNAAVVDKLLKAGADAKQLAPNGVTMVMLAARNGNPDAVKRLIAAGADVNARESLRRTTALMWAAEQKHPAAVKALLEAGADYRAKSGPAGLPRNYMAPKVNSANVEAAKKRYAAAAAAGRTYEEQLDYEIANGTAVVGSLRLLNTQGAANARGNNGSAAPQTLSQPNGRGASPPAPQPPAAGQRGNAAAAGAAPPAGQAAAGGQPAQTNQQAQGAPQSAGNEQGQPASRPPGGAAGRGQAGRSGAAAAAARQEPSDDDPDNPEIVVAGLVGTGGGGLTPLVFAAREGDIESAKLLVEAGADINQQTEYGWTPLLTATNNRHYKLATYLLEQGADPNIPNKGGWTPLYLATDNRNIEGGDYPVPKPDMDSLEYIRTVLDYGADVNARVRDNTLTRTIFTMQWLYEDGATAFLRAAQSSDVDLLKLLLEYGADPKIPSRYNDTALSVAAGIGWVEGVTYEWSKQANVDTVKLLLDLGLDPNSSNNDGRTPLMGAALKGRNEVVQMLVDKGAKLDTRDHGSRDTDNTVSKLAGHTWQALDYADGLVRVGVQSAVVHPETAALVRKLMADRGLPVPPPNRVVDSICVVELCSERVGKAPEPQQPADQKPTNSLK